MKWLLGIFICIFSCSVSLAQRYSLGHYLEVAKNNSPLLKDLHNQISSNSVDSLRLLAGYKPQVNLNSAGLYAPVINGYGYSEAITNLHTLNGLMGVNQAIVSKKNLDAQVQAIVLQSLALGNSVRISEQDLKKSITAQYITTYGDQLTLRFNEEVITLLKQEEEVLKKLTRSNVYRQSDYLTFLVTLQQQQLALSQSRAQFKNDYATLNYLAGISDTSAMQLDSPAIQKLTPHTPEGSIYTRQYNIDSLKFVNSKQTIDFSYKPKINLMADAGYESDFMGQAWKNLGFSVGFNLTVPIYDGGQRKMQYKKLSLQEETRQNYKAFYNAQYHQQIAQLQQQIKENEALIDQINEQGKYTRSLIKVDTQLLQTGDAKIADLLLAINNYLTVRNLLNQTVISRLQLINQLNYWNK